MGLLEVLRDIRVASDYWLISDEFSSIDGYLDPIEGYALMLLAEHGPGAGTIVEIGSYAGRSTSYLARGSKRARREKVVAVDHFEGSPEHRPGGEFSSDHIDGRGLFEAFTENVKRAKVDDWIHVLKAGSAEACAGWRHPIRLLFIDGEHSYEASKRDYEMWSPWLAPEGVIAFHDVGIFSGVTRYYEELLEGGGVSEILSVGTLRAVTGTKTV